MDLETKELIDYIKAKIGLNHYDLKEYYFHRKVNIFNETIYTLCTEWLPKGVKGNEDFNAKGTAIVEINVNNRKVEQILFVKEKTFVENGIEFQNKDEAIKWIEMETGLRFGEHFQLEKEENEKLIFQAMIEGVKVFPLGYIEMKCDKDGKLILFSMNGHFPSKDEVKKETFTVTLQNLEEYMKKQVKFIQSPNFDENTILPIYAVEEIFITNNEKTTIPFDFTDIHNCLELDDTLRWNEPIKKPFERKTIQLNEEITAKEAFLCEPSPDSFPITTEEVEKCKKAIQHFMQQVYSNDSGNWIIKKLYREKGYLIATLKGTKKDDFIFQRKIHLFINGQTYLVENYIDNEQLFNTFTNFHVINNVNMTKDEAYEKLKPLFKLTPYYVYDKTKEQYVLCGKLDCDYGVNIVNGEIKLLNEL